MLSILICSLHSRAAAMAKLVAHLNRQILNPNEVVIDWHIDSKEISTGTKRNLLLNRATGKYIVFIDDDDWVPSYYVTEMLIACKSGADCFAINGTMTTDGQNEVKWTISKNFDNADITSNGEKLLTRKTNHITGVKRELALLAGFPDKSNAEDKYYSDRLTPHLKTEFTISKPMYHYQFSTLNKEYK